ncbi:alpha/beta fold hydrolase [[Eubacterium] hominis]|uniref:alpha/beta fold hydrolase n=1 Tax=[Eubacterium] hominis TaxID=2764325 RepID=UPI003A4DE93E
MAVYHNQIINCTFSGEGQGMILLHGWGQNAYMMKFIQDHFAKHYRVMNLDLPGFGESEEPSHAWTLQEYADCVHTLASDAGIQKPILIAHSFGARIAFRYVLSYPVEKMILTGAAGIRKHYTWDYYVRVYTYKLLKKMKLKANLGSSDYQSASPIMRGVLVQAVNEDISDQLHLIDVETLLVWGEKDTQTPLWMGKMMEKEMKNAALVVLEKEDHFAYFHQSFRFLRIVDAFLDA